MDIHDPRLVGRSWIEGRLKDISDKLCATGARMNDAQAALQYNLLRQMLLVASSALEDEGLSLTEYRRIMDKLIYGCLPQAHEAELRLQEHRRMVTDLMSQPLRIDLGET